MKRGTLKHAYDADGKKICLDKGTFLSNLGNRSITLNKAVTRLELIQKDDPSFNYRDSWELRSGLDAIKRAVERLKKVGVKD